MLNPKLLIISFIVSTLSISGMANASSGNGNKGSSASSITSTPDDKNKESSKDGNKGPSDGNANNAPGEDRSNNEPENHPNHGDDKTDLKTSITLDDKGKESFENGNKEPLAGENHGSPDDLLSGVLGEYRLEDGLGSEVDINFGDNKVNLNLKSNNITSAIPEPEVHAMLLIGLMLLGLPHYRERNIKIASKFQV